MFANNKRIIPNLENSAKVKLSTHLYSYSIQFYWKAILRMSQNTILLSHIIPRRTFNEGCGLQVLSHF